MLPHGSRPDVEAPAAGCGNAANMQLYYLMSNLTCLSNPSTDSCSQMCAHLLVLVFCLIPSTKSIKNGNIVTFQSHFLVVVLCI